MTYQIDQSGKIEQTNKVTVLAYCNDISYTIVIPAKVKRQLQEAFRKCGITRLFIPKLFAAGIFFLLAKLEEKSYVIIDREYPGKEKIITNLLQKLFSAFNKPLHNISFSRIGNKPKVHYAAHDVYVKKVIPQRVLKLGEIIRALKKTDGRLRECLSTLVDAQPRPLIKIYHRRFKKSRLK